jgi:hypothetical protein
VGTDSDRRGDGSSSGREGEDWAGHECADGANREDGGSEDVSPNAHDYLHAFAEVDAATCAFGGPAGNAARVFPITSFWLISLLG